jgi:lipoprotein-anchoring transpeptidase ErfK/SrfK
MNLTVPTETQPFASVTPTAFSKLIEVNVVTKQMYLYDNGNLTKTYPISAGAPVTPTPIGQFKIYQKLAVQDMKGFNADGTKYLQPHVHWINYFLPGGYAVHGNYWRPLSWFGAVNSSHGCVSLPDDQAKEVYDWAPLGTTVITHY